MPVALGNSPIVAFQGPVIIKLASIHTHQWPTPKGDLLFFTPTLFAQVVLYFASVLPCSPSFPASFPRFSSGGQLIDANRLDSSYLRSCHLEFPGLLDLPLLLSLYFARPPWALSAVPQTSSERPDSSLCDHPTWFSQARFWKKLSDALDID